jgi:hypothetical protein
VLERAAGGGGGDAAGAPVVVELEAVEEVLELLGLAHAKF